MFRRTRKGVLVVSGGLLAVGVVFVLFVMLMALVTSLMSQEGPTGRGVMGVPEDVEGYTEVPLAAVFAGWYGHDPVDGSCRGGPGSTHWNDSPDTGGVVYTPAPGFYCSSDPEVVSWQLEQMEKAGISVVLYSWWGWGDYDLDGVVEGHPDQHINQALTEMLDQIRDSGLDMQIALIVEPFTVTQGGGPGKLTSRQSQMVLDYLWKRYYAKYPHQMFHWQGKPLLVTFDPLVLREDDRYTVKRLTGRPKDLAMIEEGWEWFFAPPQSVIAGMSNDGVAFVYPRFDEFYLAEGGATYIAWEPRRIDPDLDGGVYESQWQELEQFRSQIKMIVLYSWNVYGEQSHIEPSSGGPAPVGDEYPEKTRRYYASFKEAQ